MSECQTCGNVGWVCAGNCTDPSSHKSRSECLRPERCKNCYYRIRKPVEHYDNVRGEATVVAFTCGHGAEYSYEAARPCDVCREEAKRIEQAVKQCGQHNQFINQRRK